MAAKLFWVRPHENQTFPETQLWLCKDCQKELGLPK